MARLVSAIAIWLSLAAPVSGETRDLLFIGNSFTRYWGVANMVSQLARTALPGDEIIATDISENGMTLDWHVHEGDALGTVSAGPWDAVILQDFSDVALVLEKRDASQVAAGRIAAQGAGDKLVFFAPWAPGRVPPEARPAATLAIEDHYRALAAANGGAVAPVGRAFRVALAAGYPEALRAPDDHHATVEGAYLAALVIAATLFGADRVLAPGSAGWRPDGVADQNAERLRGYARRALAEYNGTIPES
ncbi:MAG: hypothetical protein AAF503_01765 [Pseudomonadota bacterium]